MCNEIEFRSYLREFIPISYGSLNTIYDDTELVRSGVIDSFGIVQIINGIEQEFSMKVPDIYLTPENFSTINAIARCLMTIQSSNQ